jgi:hypothetical protein
MAIGNAVERDQFVYVYDEKGYHLSTLFAGNVSATVFLAILVIALFSSLAEGAFWDTAKLDETG